MATVESLLPVLEQARQEFPDCIAEMAAVETDFPFIALGVRDMTAPIEYRYTCIAAAPTIGSLRWQRSLVCLLSERPGS